MLPEEKQRIILKNLNRNVKKGEKALKIIAPLTYKGKNDDGEDEMFIKGFRAVPVFDISQTEGEAVPTNEFKIKTIDGDVENYNVLVQEIIGISPYSVDFVKLEKGHDGSCNHTKRIIKVNDSLSEKQTLLALVHELGHCLSKDFEDEVNHENRVVEVNAESIGYIVCKSLGIEAIEDNSINYIMTYLGKLNEEQIGKILNHSNKIASNILESLNRVDVA